VFLHNISLSFPNYKSHISFENHHTAKTAMSVAGSHLHRSHVGDDEESGTQAATSLGPVIAVDLDDVLSQTNATIALCMFCARLLIMSSLISIHTGHNEKFGTDMTLNSFYCMWPSHPRRIHKFDIIPFRLLLLEGEP
jgi:hypothetical protein